MAFTDPVKNLERLGLQPGHIVADLGAGSGFYTIEAARLVGGNGKVYAIDVQQELLSRLKNAAHNQKIHHVEVIHGDVERLGGTRLREHSVHAAIVSNILFQLEHKDDFVNEVKRILKPNGKVLVIDWADSFGGMGPAAEHVITQADAKALFEKHGFVFDSSLNPGDHHYGFIFRTP